MLFDRVQVTTCLTIGTTPLSLLLGGTCPVRKCTYFVWDKVLEILHDNTLTSPSQVRYACLDALASVLVYFEIEKLKDPIRSRPPTTLP